MDRVVIEGDQLKNVLHKLEETKRRVDDLIDAFEMLQDQRFLSELCARCAVRRSVDNAQ